MPRLQNKVALITGGTSGIGLATGQRFVAESAFDAETSSPDEAAAVRAKHAANIPLGRLARLQEIAARMLFLHLTTAASLLGVNCWWTAACARSELAHAIVSGAVPA